MRWKAGSEEFQEEKHTACVWSFRPNLTCVDLPAICGLVFTAVNKGPHLRQGGR